MARAAGRVLHRQRHAADAVERVERAGHRAGGRHKADLADALGAERPLGLGLLDEDDLDLAACRCARKHADVAQLEGDRHAVDAGQLLGERVAEAHVDRALDLRRRRAAG